MSERDDKKSSKPGSLQDDPLFSGRGAPAFMSQKEPAIRLLRERYSESFAVVPGSGQRIHLFLVKVGLWALVRTFVPKDMGRAGETVTLEHSLALIENALSGKNPKLLEGLDASIARAKSRIAIKTEQLGVKSEPLSD